MKNKEIKFRKALASAVRNNRTNNTTIILNVLSGIRRVKKLNNACELE